MPTSLRFALHSGLAVLALLAAATAARATVVVDVPLEEMVAASDAIVVGSVEETGSRLEMRGGRLVPVTRTRIRAIRWIAGSGDRHLTLSTPGGHHPGGERRVVGAPRFRPGEQLLLFLRRDGEVYVPFGLALGVYRITRGRGPVPAHLARHEDGLVVARRRDGKLVLGAPDPAAAPVPLSAFLARVEALARGEGAP